MNSEKLFQFLSYAAVFFGFFALWISGVFGVIGTGLFLAAMIAGWFLEDTRWQIRERLGTVLIVAALPIYFGLYKAGYFSFSSSDAILPGVLARLIVSLSAVKILQRKSDRDWIFLYVMSFFQVLLAAGLSISALYFVTFLGYLFVMVCTVVLFEIRKTKGNYLRQRAAERPSQKTNPLDLPSVLPARRVPAAATVLIVFIVSIAAPLFFLLPRVGGAGFGGGSGGGTDTSSGFSDSVRLGGVGRIQQNDAIVMRVRLDGVSASELDDIRWRGIALDTFDNQTWRKSKPGFPDRLAKGGNELTQIEPARGRGPFVLQTVYLEPVNLPILFVLPRAVGIQSPMPFVMRDMGGALSFPSKGDRTSYRVLSETTLPDIGLLRRDNGLYADQYHNYLQLPEAIDPRIEALASEVIRGTRTRYDAAKAIEAHLQTQFGYTLEQKAGGDQPVSDFLFNVREGHCEYFSTAMTIMLRTQGIAARVVNGFQRGEYNETADVFVVRQRNAHSWVEVYFPDQDTWVTFDPTPFAGQNLTSGSSGLGRTLNSYLEALETFWIQYFVAYDSAEQRSLLTSVRRNLSSYGRQTSSWVDAGREQVLAWWRIVRGDEGFANSAIAIGYGLAVLASVAAFVFLFGWLYRWIVQSTIWRRIRERLFGTRGGSIVEFYERMLRVLESKGLIRQPHQTPLEFACAAGMPEAVSITEKYNRVRFGEKALSAAESAEIDKWLKELAASERGSE